MRPQLLILGLGIGALALTQMVPVLAQTDEDDYFDRSPEKCISPSRIREIEVIDEETILFYMRGRTIYRNLLRRTCIGLDDRDRIRYDVRGGRLCNSDSITVLPMMGGFDPGQTCFLGNFHPITREEAEVIEMDSNEPGSGRGSVVMTPLPDPEPADSASGDADGDGEGDSQATGTDENGDGQATSGNDENRDGRTDGENP